MTKKEKMLELVRQFADQAREYHRTGNAVMRREAEEDIRRVAPRAYAAKVLRDLYRPTAAV